MTRADDARLVHRDPAFDDARHHDVTHRLTRLITRFGSYQCVASCPGAWCSLVLCLLLTSPGTPATAGPHPLRASRGSPNLRSGPISLSDTVSRLNAALTGRYDGLTPIETVFTPDEIAEFDRMIGGPRIASTA